MTAEGVQESPHQQQEQTVQVLVQENSQQQQVQEVADELAQEVNLVADDQQAHTMGQNSIQIIGAFPAPYTIWYFCLFGLRTNYSE